MYEDLGVVPPAGPGTESSYFRGFRAQALQLKIFETFSGKICGRPRAVAECDHKLTNITLMLNKFLSKDPHCTPSFQCCTFCVMNRPCVQCSLHLYQCLAQYAMARRPF